MDMAADARLSNIIEALKLASDENSAYFDTESTVSGMSGIGLEMPS